MYVEDVKICRNAIEGQDRFHLKEGETMPKIDQRNTESIKIQKGTNYTSAVLTHPSDS
jgi:hypothetical protein